jgi:hypothetical protein
MSAPLLDMSPCPSTVSRRAARDAGERAGRRWCPPARVGLPRRAADPGTASPGGVNGQVFDDVMSKGAVAGRIGRAGRLLGR